MDIPLGDIPLDFNTLEAITQLIVLLVGCP